MKRAALILLVLSVATSALPFDSKERPRVALLDSVYRNDTGDLEPYVSQVQGYLQRELRKRGLDAFESRDTIVDVEEGRAADDVDYFVEVLDDESRNESYGGGGVVHGNVSVGAEYVVSQVRATVRLYDRELNVLGTFHVEKEGGTLVPTGIGFGRRSFGIWVAGSIVQAARGRAAVRAAAREAADRIAETISPAQRPQPLEQ
jgi:hypothetical protein